MSIAARSHAASVVVVTYERPEYLARCLEHLLAQSVAPAEIVVVDSSMTTISRELVADRFPSVRYLACSLGRGAIATARNIGLGAVSGDIIAFVDDDAFAERDWLEQLLSPYADPSIGGVGGRQIRKQPDELEEGVNEIGRLRPDGTLTGFFAADPGRIIEVDHLLGANMSFRRSVLVALGGIRDGYPGTCIREETDLCLRVAHAGYHLLFNPDSVVEHMAAPYARGTRFDLRYAYFAQRNHVVLLVRNFGPVSPILLRFFSSSMRSQANELRRGLRITVERFRRGDFAAGGRSLVNSTLRTVIAVGATPVGYVSGVALRREERR